MPDYDFMSLSSTDFEELVRDILQAETGVLIQSFGPGKDTGIDLRYATNSENWIVQAKRYGESSKNSLISNIIKDARKIQKLLPTRYIVATSLHMQPSSRAQLVRDVDPVPLSDGDIWTKKELNNLLGKHPEIERRHFKLWLSSVPVLQRILKNVIYAKSEWAVSQIKSKIQVFVSNKSVDEANDVLRKHNCLIISGPPGVGKTTLARMLILLHLDQEWELVSFDKFDEANDVFSENSKQIFFFDDFLGRTRLTPDYLNDVDQPLVTFIERIRASKNKRFVMTTREYIFKQALAVSDRIDSPNVLVSKIVLDVGIYTRRERAKILYNHAFFSDLSDEQKSAFMKDKLYKKVIDHKNFNPRVIETLTNANFFEGYRGQDYGSVALETLDNPELIWSKAYRGHISSGAKALLAAIHFSENPVSLGFLEQKFQSLVGWAFEGKASVDRTAFLEALKELEGSFLSIEIRSSYGRRIEQVDYFNPSIGDFLERELSNTNVAFHVLREFQFVAQAREAWRFIERHPRLLTAAVERQELLVSAAEKVASAPVEVTFFNSIGGVERRVNTRWAYRLELLFDIYSMVPDDRIAKAIERSAEEIAPSLGVEPVEKILELIAIIDKKLMRMPIALRNSIYEKMYDHVAGLMQHMEGVLTVSEISRINLTHKNGFIRDENYILKLRGALQTIVDMIQDEVDNIGSLDELDDYEAVLIPLLKTVAIDTLDPERAIEGRREELQDKIIDSDFDYDEPRASEGQITDVEIESLFSGLGEG